MSVNQKLIQLDDIINNEKKYAHELREKYRELNINTSFQKIKNSNIQDIQNLINLLN